VLHCGLVLSGVKADDSATRSRGHGIDLRETLVETLHPDLIHANLRQFRTEFSFGCRKKLYVGGLNGRLTQKRVVKGEYPAPRHFHTPGFAEN
jgi:hypothetical protein